MEEPLISVVMPLYNGMPFLPESIQSILNQTLRNFEFVILNNGSNDGSENVLLEWQRKDPRIHVYNYPERLGLSKSSNLVVSKATAQLIARMDADDVCAPDRLERQWSVMNANPEVALVGTLSDGIDAAGRTVRTRDRSRILRRSTHPPFPHGSAMFRRYIFNAVGGYRAEAEGFEDQDLFLRMAAVGKIVTLPEPLYHYRYHIQSSTAYLKGLQEADELTLYSLGAMRLWAGQRPSILRPLIKDKSSGWSLQKLMTTAWAAWGELNAKSLRYVSGLIVQTRDLLASTRVSDGRFYEWRFK